MATKMITLVYLLPQRKPRTEIQVMWSQFVCPANQHPNSTNQRGRKIRSDGGAAIMTSTSCQRRFDRPEVNVLLLHFLRSNGQLCYFLALVSAVLLGLWTPLTSCEAASTGSNYDSARSFLVAPTGSFPNKREILQYRLDTKLFEAKWLDTKGNVVVPTSCKY